ncbi:MAG: histidine triad nucleotide-binding protein [Desulfobulbaceae bacterium]|nr:histidine triad nucleotide-binding protein [Desulfobulbaceae bacterium]MCK5436725.1 histidine triad nucleotide-binding protein [Desulfobulbaceae bacterium]MCK5545578.1 histidine triad nucleotide-binding protein [Desulfobulbaceae bacterium]
MDDNCLFCKIIKGEIPVEKLFEDDDVLVFDDINPQAPTHFLVIPKKHLSGPAAASMEDDGLIGKVFRTGCEVARKKGIDHYRLVLNNGEQAGQAVFHLHLHILGGRPLTWPPG